MIKDIMILVFELIGAIVYRLCVPVMFLLIICKLWYEPYTWSWFSTIAIPLGCGACGFIVALIARYWG